MRNGEQLNRIEIWKDIPNYEGMYQVSNNGRVKSLERYITRKNKTKCKIECRILKPWQNKQGYWEITLCKNGKKHHIRLNRLVAYTFVFNDDPIHKVEVNHVDEKKENNCDFNLSWVTSAENKQHSIRLHKNDPEYGARNHNKKNKKQK
jgi:hypothetical protein